jgi:hypothetical protein
VIDGRFLLGKIEKKKPIKYHKEKRKEAPWAIEASNSFFKMPCFLQKKYFHLIT